MAVAAGRGLGGCIGGGTARAFAWLRERHASATMNPVNAPAMPPDHPSASAPTMKPMTIPSATIMRFLC